MNKATLKNFFDLFGIICECFLFLWLVLGLWACAHKLRTLEETVDRLESVSKGVECPENKLHLMAFRCQKMEQDNDMLRLRIEELEDINEDNEYWKTCQLSRIDNLETFIPTITNMNHSVDLPAWRVTDLKSNAPPKQYRLVNGVVVVEDYLVPLTNEKEEANAKAVDDLTEDPNFVD